MNLNTFLISLCVKMLLFMSPMFVYFQGGLSARHVSKKSHKSQIAADPAANLSLQSRLRNMYPPMSPSGKIQEVSENSESDLDGRRSDDRDSWTDRMHVSTNSESEGSTIAEHHIMSNTDYHTGLELHQVASDSPPPLEPPEVFQQTEEYSLSRQESQQSADRFSFTHDNDGRHSRSSHNSESEESIYFQKSRTFNSEQQEPIDTDINVCNMNDLDTNTGLHVQDIGHEDHISVKLELDANSDRSHIDPEVISAESGIHSDVTSSNMSDTSQQSIDGQQFDPSEVAMKVLQDLGGHKQILDEFQQESLVSSKRETFLKRQQFDSQQLSKVNLHKQLVPESDSHVQEEDNNFKTASNHSLQTVSQKLKSKVPPPVPAKPKLAQKPSTLVSNLQRLISMEDSGPEDNTHSPSTGSLTQKPSDEDLQYVVTRRTMSSDNKLSSHTSMPNISETLNDKYVDIHLSSSTNQMQKEKPVPSLRSFRPQPKRNAGMMGGSLPRPDSTTSTSSHCSSASSVQSVIHRPFMNSLKEQADMFESPASSQSSPSLVGSPRSGPDYKPLPPYNGTNAAYYLKRGSPTHQYYSSSSCSSTPTWKHNSSPDISTQYSMPVSTSIPVSSQPQTGNQTTSSSTVPPSGSNASGAVNRLDSLLESCQVQNADFGQKLNSSYYSQSLNSSGNSIASNSVHALPVSQKQQLDNSGSSLSSYQALNSSSDSFQDVSYFQRQYSKGSTSSFSNSMTKNMPESPSNSTTSAGSPLPRSVSPSSSTTSRGSPYQYLSNGQKPRTKSILNSSPASIRGHKKRPSKRVSFSDSEPSDLENQSPNPYKPQKPDRGLVKMNSGDYHLPGPYRYQNGNVTPSSVINPVTGQKLPSSNYGQQNGNVAHSHHNNQMTPVNPVTGNMLTDNGYVTKNSIPTNGYPPLSYKGRNMNGDIVREPHKVQRQPASPRNGYGPNSFHLTDSSLKTRTLFGKDGNQPIRRTQVIHTSKC